MPLGTVKPCFVLFEIVALLYIEQVAWSIELARVNINSYLFAQLCASLVPQLSLTLAFTHTEIIWGGGFEVLPVSLEEG